MKITGQVRQTGGAQGGLSALPRCIDAALSATLAAGAERVLARARALVPVLTGRLRASLSVLPAPDGRSFMIGQTEDGARDAPYAAAVEFGTARQPAQPYLVPALEAERDALTVAVDGAIREALRHG